jgi:hypothetical protein
MAPIRSNSRRNRNGQLASSREPKPTVFDQKELDEMTSQLESVSLVPQTTLQQHGSKSRKRARED